MTTTLDGQPSVVGPASPPAGTRVMPDRRRFGAARGLLMQRAVDLRDEMPRGRRRADTPRWRSWAQVMAGMSLLTVGMVTLYFIGPSWNWLGAVAAVVGPTVMLLGVVDLARRGAHGHRRLGRLLRMIRVIGLALTTMLIAVEVLAALAAVVLLGAAVFRGEWSPDVAHYLANALLLAVMAGCLTMMVRVADLPAVALTQAVWWRELSTARQFTTIAIPVALVGAVVALGVRDTRAVAVAMVGLTAVLVGWARADRAATDEAVRRLAEAADALAAASRSMVAAVEAGAPPSKAAARTDAVLEALERLDLACHRNMRRGIPAGTRYLVDVELLIVIRACRAVLVDSPIEHFGSPLTATVARELTVFEPRLLARELLIFAGDVRRLATLAPDRLVAL